MQHCKVRPRQGPCAPAEATRAHVSSSMRYRRCARGLHGQQQGWHTPNINLDKTAKGANVTGLQVTCFDVTCYTANCKPASLAMRMRMRSRLALTSGCVWRKGGGPPSRGGGVLGVPEGLDANHHHHQKAFMNKSHTSHGHRPGLKRNKSKGKSFFFFKVTDVTSLYQTLKEKD